MAKQTIAVDFDGVIHKYSRGWADGTIYDDPIPGAMDAILNLMNRGYNIVIFTARPIGPIHEWMERHWKAKMYPIPDITNTKPAAIAYIDDRAVRFNGDWAEMLALFPWKTK